LRYGGWAYLRERLGYIATRNDHPVWLHGASVGEIVAAAPLVKALADRGIGPVVISTNTATGRARAQDLMPPEVGVVYLPIDRPRPVNRFIERLTPRAALILETELWPHLVAALHQQGILTALVNARLSKRSLEAPHWWRHTAGWCLGHIDAILARSDTDRAAFERLGAPADRVQVIGNLKWAMPIGPPPEPIELGRPFVLAASTHADEEQQLARALRSLGHQSALWVMAPRHPQRGSTIRRKLEAAGWPVAQRSLGEAVPSGPAIYVTDTLGELPGLMGAAHLVVMGGSLIPHGGQNVLEPARAGCPMITGPHMENFADETAGLRASGALIEADDAEQVVSTADRLLNDRDKRLAMAANAREWLARQTDPAARYRQVIAELLREPDPSSPSLASQPSDGDD
jgi:3-deoxy-D-manno-octulosonic-acid transferase